MILQDHQSIVIQAYTIYTISEHIMGGLSPSNSDLHNYISKQYIPVYIKNFRSFDEDLLNKFSILDQKDSDRIRFTAIFERMKQKGEYDPKMLGIQDVEVERCIASLLGLAICDALGASTQFTPYTKSGHAIINEGFGDIVTAIENGLLDSRAGKVGIWTDDCSMALCMADSLIYYKYRFEPKHIRYLFLLWFFNGLNNGGRKHSIGLGGNIKISMEEFMNRREDFCELGDQFNNGNGSLMRLAPIPIVFRESKEMAMKYSEQSSRTTHNGIQAKQCCRLLSSILTQLYQHTKKSPFQALQAACNSFHTECTSVQYLALSMEEPEEDYLTMCKKYGNKFKKFNLTPKDRNWNWKDKNFTYSQTRAEDKPGYVGSYCMDALAMALHTVWHTKSFKEVALVNANMGGDCDTVGAIAGQIAGAMYGIDRDMLKLYSEMVDFQNGKYEVFLKAYKLAKRL